MAQASKSQLRKQLRAARRAHVEALPETIRGLVFRHPPAPLLERLPEGATIGLYRATPFEAPTASYVKYFHEHGFPLALPRFAHRTATMEFAAFVDPYEESDLEPGAFGMVQPGNELDSVVPDVLIMPLVGFTARGERLGQGGGHYDRWLEAHPDTPAFGLAWDVQLCDELPIEEHDIALNAIVTPTRFYGPF